MNRRTAILLAFALGLAACGRRGSPRRPKGDSDDDDASAPRSGRPPPPDFERKDEE